MGGASKHYIYKLKGKDKLGIELFNVKMIFKQFEDTQTLIT